MAHLLHIDSSVLGDYSVSRKLSALTAARWQATHPGAPSATATRRRTRSRT
jgi:FMN-dependent NADH-azoreductase